LINRARPFIYSTAPSPWIGAALLRSLEFARSAKEQRRHLHAISGRVRLELSQLGFDIGKTESFIIPVILNSEEKTLNFRNQLEEHGVLVSAVRPPTVPDGTCRLRLSLTADFNDNDLDRLLSAMKSIAR
jgi:7-keto-8-aminopelargonate synthetase-like enzyme